MSYIKIAYAAIQRHRLEKPYIDLFMEHFPRLPLRTPFYVMGSRLAQKGLIDKKKFNVKMRRYRKLSKKMHYTG